MAKFTKTNKAILHDGTIDFTGNQSMGGLPNENTSFGKRITNAQNAVDPQDYVTKSQTFPRITETDATSGVYTIYVDFNAVAGAGNGTQLNPFKTPHEAFEWLSDYSIDTNIIVKIQCAAGKYLLTEQLNINHPNGSQIHLLGELDETPYTFAGTPLGISDINSRGYNITIPITESLVSGDFIGHEWLLISLAGFNSDDDYGNNQGQVLNGAWKYLSSVDTGSVHSITARIRVHPSVTTVTQPKNGNGDGTTCDGNIYVAKTVFIWTVPQLSITLNENNTLGVIDKIAIVADDNIELDTAGYGLYVRNNSSVSLGGYTLFANWYVGIDTRYGGTINHRDYGYSAVSNCYIGANNRKGSSMDVIDMSFSGCHIGIKCEQTSFIFAKGCCVTNNSYGISLTNNSSAEIGGQKLKFNGWGAYLTVGSVLRAIGAGHYYGSTSCRINHSGGINIRHGSQVYFDGGWLNNNGFVDWENGNIATRGTYDGPCDINIYSGGKIRCLNLKTSNWQSEDLLLRYAQYTNANASRNHFQLINSQNNAGHYTAATAFHAEINGQPGSFLGELVSISGYSQ